MRASETLVSTIPPLMHEKDSERIRTDDTGFAVRCLNQLGYGIIGGAAEIRTQTQKKILLLHA